MENEESISIQDIPINIHVLKAVENGENIYKEDPLKFNDLVKDIVNKNIYDIKNKKIDNVLDDLNEYLYSNNKSIKKLNIKLKRAKIEKDYSKSLNIIKEILKIKPKDLKICNANLYLHLIEDSDKYDNSEIKNNSFRYLEIREIIDEILEINPEDQEKLLMKYYIMNKLYLTEEDIAREKKEIEELERNTKYEIAATLIDEGELKEGLSLTNKIFLEYEGGYDFWDYNDYGLNQLDNSEETIEFLNALLEENPKNYDVHLKLGDCYKKIKSYKEAIEHYDVLIESGDEVHENSGMFEKVKILRKLKKFDDALSIIEYAMENTFDTIDFAREQIFIYLDMGEYGLAMNVADEIKEYDSEFHCLKGYIYLEWKKYRKSEKCFKRSIKLIDDYSGKVSFYLAQSLKEQKKYGEALKYLKEIPFIKQYTKYYDKAQDLIAEIENMNLSKEELINHEEEKELKIDEAANLIDEEKYKEGLTLINKIFIEYCDGYEFWDYNDHAINKLANNDENIKFLNNLIKDNPKNLDAHFRLGTFYEENKEYETAIEHYDACIDLGDEVHSSYGKLYKGQVLRKLKRFDESMEIMDWGIENGNDFGDFMEEKCLNYIDMEEFDLASEAIDKFSKYTDLSCVKGYYYLRTKKYDKAVEFFKKSINNVSRNIFMDIPNPKFYLGLTFKEWGKYKKALKTLKDIEFEENNTRYYNKAQDLIAEIENELMDK